MQKQKKLSIEEKTYLTQIDSNNLDFNNFEINQNHIFIDDTKKAEFFHFKNLLTLKTNNFEAPTFPSYQWWKLSVPKTLKNNILMKLISSLVKNFSTEERMIQTKLGILDFTDKNDALLALALTLEDYTENNFTALMYAVKQKNREAFEYFIDKGSDINYLGVMDKLPHSALSLAIQTHQNEIAQYLINHGANIYELLEHNGELEDLLDLSIDSHNFEMAQTLIDLGIDVNWVNEKSTDSKFNMQNSRLMKIASFEKTHYEKALHFYLANNFTLFDHYNGLDQHLFIMASKSINCDLMSLALAKGNDPQHASKITKLKALDYVGGQNGKFDGLKEALKKDGIGIHDDSFNENFILDLLLQIHEQKEFEQKLNQVPIKARRKIKI